MSTHPRLSESVQPWYRHAWPWILMVGPLIVIVAGALTLYLAIVSNDGLVDDDYYKQGLAVNQLTARIHHASRLGLKAKLFQSTEGHRIRILLSGNPGTALPDVVSLRIAHPTRAGSDQNLLLKTDTPGSYTGELNIRLTGRWHVTLEDAKGEWRLAGDWNTEKGDSLRLPVELNTAVHARRDDIGR